MRSNRSVALAAAAVLSIATAIAGLDAIAAPTAIAKGKPQPTPSPSPTVTPAPVAGPTGAAVGGWLLAITADISSASSAFVVPTPHCMTETEQAIAFGLAGLAESATPASTAVVIVGCHGVDTPFALARVQVGSSQSSAAISFGAHVAVERSSSGGNATTTVENTDLAGGAVASRRVQALGGSADTSVAFGAFAVLGSDGLALEVPDFAAVALEQNQCDGALLANSLPIATDNQHVTVSSVDDAGRFTVNYQQ